MACRSVGRKLLGEAVARASWTSWPARAAPWAGNPHCGEEQRLNCHGLRVVGAGRRGVQARVAQLVERILGKDKVTGSIPVPGSTEQAMDGWPSG